jgi:hypothetical protein
MPVIGSVSDDPVVLLLQDPCEVGPVVVSVHGSVPDEAVDQDGGFAILECEGRVVDVQVLWEGVVCGVEAGSFCQGSSKDTRRPLRDSQGNVRCVWVGEIAGCEA